MQFFDDFADDPIGSTALPAGWTQQWDTSGTDFQIIADAEAPAGRKLRITKTANNRSLIECATGTDFEIAALVRVPDVVDGKSNISLVGRASGTGTSETGYVAQIVDNGAGDYLRIYRYNGGTFSDDLAVGDLPVAPGLYWFTFAGTLNMFVATLEPLDTAQPVVTATLTDSDISGSGWVGLMLFNGNQFADVLAVGVGTEGDMAPRVNPNPLPPPMPNPIQVFDDFETGNVIVATGDSVSITFEPEPAQWRHFGARFTGLLDAQTAFTVPAANDNINGFAPCFSYSPEGPFFDFDFHQFGSTEHTFSHGAPFTQDTVYVYSAAPFTPTMVADWMAAEVVPSHYVTPLVSDADHDYVLHMQTGGVTAWGKSVPDKEVYGFKVSDPSVQPPGGKMVCHVMGGQHADESQGNWALKGFIDWMLGPSTEAAKTRHRFDFFVYPMHNPVARAGGIKREFLEGGDPNRDWDKVSSNPATIAMKSHFTIDFGDTLHVHLGFHGHNSNTSAEAFASGQQDDAALWAAIDARAPALTEAALMPGHVATSIGAWMDPTQSQTGNFSPALAVLTPELPPNFTQMQNEALGVAIGLGLHDQYALDLTPPDPGGGTYGKTEALADIDAAMVQLQQARDWIASQP